MSGSGIGGWRATMASNIWHSFMSFRFSGFKSYLEAGAGWFAQVKEMMSPQVRHKIKMASMHMSMDEVSKTYKITPIRRL
jgi:hypothetical protein